MRGFVAGADRAQPGHAAKLANAMPQLVNAPEPPLPIPFGSDTARRIESKNAFVAQERIRWRDLALATDFAAAE